MSAFWILDYAETLQVPGTRCYWKGVRVYQPTGFHKTMQARSKLSVQETMSGSGWLRPKQ